MTTGATAVYIPPAFGMGANVGPDIPGTTRPAFITALGGSSPALRAADVNPAKIPLGATWAYNSPAFGHSTPLPYPPAVDPPSPAGGYSSRWQWHAPPGMGDAPQHVWQTYYLAPISLMGPGDAPIGVINTTRMNPSIQNFAMRRQGFGVTGGNMLMSGLYTPEPLSPY